MPSHQQTSVKVNAHVDQGVAQLVAALSEISALETLESCQGDDNQPAFVIFRFGSWRTCGKFMFDGLLLAMDQDLRSDVSLSIVGYSATYCHGRISLPPSAVESMANLVRSVHRSACSRDTLCTSQGNC
jgi:hypothetical protein